MKSKRDHGTIEKLFRKISRYGELLHGGSFRKYYTNHLASRHGKRFVILVPRLPHNNEFPLYVSEIEDIHPALEGKTFATYAAKKTLFIGSKVKLKQVGRRWCSILCPPNLTHNAKLWAKEVYDEEFGAESWNTEAAAAAAAAVATTTTSTAQHPLQKNADPTDSLKVELEQLCIRDNWDSSDDEEEV